jgi:hypothetical protein
MSQVIIKELTYFTLLHCEVSYPLSGADASASYWGLKPPPKINNFRLILILLLF